MDRATAETVTLIETLGATAYGSNRMAFAIDIEINRELPTTKRVDELQILAGRCIDLDIQRKDATAIASRLSNSNVLLGKELQQLVLDFTAIASGVGRLCIIGRDWTAPDAPDVLRQLTALSILLAELFGQIFRELERLENSVAMSTTTRSTTRARRAAFGRRTTIDKTGL